MIITMRIVANRIKNSFVDYIEEDILAFFVSVIYYHIGFSMFPGSQALRHKENRYTNVASIVLVFSFFSEESDQLHETPKI